MRIGVGGAREQKTGVSQVGGHSCRLRGEKEGRNQRKGPWGEGATEKIEQSNRNGKSVAMNHRCNAICPDAGGGLIPGLSTIAKP